MPAVEIHCSCGIASSLTLDSGGRSAPAQRLNARKLLALIRGLMQDDLHIRVQGSLQEPLHLSGVGGVLSSLLDLAWC